MILNETMVEIADAIREKTGKSELIKPVDFATEIKGITSGGGESGDDGWVYYKFDGKAVENTEGFDAAELYIMIGQMCRAYYMSSAYKLVDRVEEKLTLTAMQWDEDPISHHLAFKTQTSVNLLKGVGFPISSVMSMKELIAYIDEMTGGQNPPLMVAFANALTPCTKEEFEALITA